MKPNPLFYLILSGALVVSVSAIAQSDPPPLDDELIEEMLAEVALAAEAPPEGEVAPAPAPAPETARGTEPAASSRRPASTNGTTTGEVTIPVDKTPVFLPSGEPGVRLNFRGAPLELVLNYLSEAAGFIIVPETDLRGRVDVWSNQPLSKDEAVEVLNQVLSKNGYAVLREGRTLTILRQEDARKRDIPVRSGYEPASIPKSAEVVTQIIPVRFINATQLIKDLSPLLPLSTTMTANEGGNAIVITDTQINIRRMAEIIKALDTTVSSLSAVRVFPLRYADATSVATVIKDVFSTGAGSTQQGGDRGRQFGFFRGGPFGGGGDAGGATGAVGGRPGAGRVVATADERSNSLVVSAPDDLMPTIEELVASVDTSVEDVTEVRVFKLKYSDPQEMSTLLASLFPDETSTQRGGGGNRRFGGFFGGQGGGGGQAAAGETSDRAKRQSRVIAVPDYRTSSVVVSASREMMFQIAGMVEQLDADPAKQQKVFVYELKNADVGNAEEIVRGLFEGQNTRRTTTQTRSALETREAQTQNQQNTSGFGTQGTGRGGAGQTFR